MKPGQCCAIDGHSTECTYPQSHCGPHSYFDNPSALKMWPEMACSTPGCVHLHRILEGVVRKVGNRFGVTIGGRIIKLSSEDEASRHHKRKMKQPLAGLVHTAISPGTDVQETARKRVFAGFSPASANRTWTPLPSLSYDARMSVPFFAPRA